MNIREFIQAKSQNRYDQITEMTYEEGGFGRLYKAIDTHRQGREVCIKVIKPHLSKDLQMKLWREEVQALELYSNRSGIVHLVEKQYEFTPEDPYWFLVMEYVHGQRLGSSKYRVELDVEEDLAIRIVFQLCSVIYSIHQRGKYHQDIFPDNIKIQGEDVILLDLGGMREAERRSGTIIFGGEMYSPPEVSPTRLRMKRFRTLRKQKMGSFESADIFSIGAICYELLMGESFYENIEQSNQLKEYIYDHYTDPAMVKQMKKEYKEALNTVQRNMKRFSLSLERYRMPADLRECLSNMLAPHPQKRPSVEDVLQRFLPYMVQQGNAAYLQKQWKQAQLWIQLVEHHFDEIQLETRSDDEGVQHTMLRHLMTHLSLYVETCMMRGVCQFHQELYETAQRTFLKIRDILDTYPQGLPERERNTVLVKIANNLAACLHKRSQSAEALHLLNSLSTAQGNLGQIINHNRQVCTA